MKSNMATSKRIWIQIPSTTNEKQYGENLLLLLLLLIHKRKKKNYASVSEA